MLALNCRKDLWIRMVKITALVLPAVLLILLLPIGDNNLYCDTPRVRGYYMEEPDSLDVVILGSSENFAGYSPVLAYEEYGFTSYPFVFMSNAFSIFDIQLEEALRVQSPQMVLVDIGELIHVAERDEDRVFRWMVAGMPFSLHKIQLIHEYANPDEILEYYFPFISTHNTSSLKSVWDNWKGSYLIQKRGYTLLKGTDTDTGTGENLDGPYVTPRNTTGDYSTAELQPEVIRACQRVMDACRRYPDIRFIFINTPHRINTEERYRNYQEINAAGALLEEGGFAFINLESMTDEIGIDPKTDYYNRDHLNLYGQYKATRFLCDILTGEYGLKPRELSSENREKWDTCVEYRYLHYQLFEEQIKKRTPEGYGRSLHEDLWTLSKLEEMRQANQIS